MAELSNGETSTSETTSTASTHPSASSAVTGIGAPANTPAEIIDKLNKEINAAFTDPAMKARLLEIGDTALPGSPADFGRLMAGETAKWAKVIKSSSAKR